MFYSCQAIEECESTNLWLLDNAYSNHMTSDKSLFSSLDISIKTKVKSGDDYLVYVQGKGTIFVLSKHNELKDIIEFYYVNGLKHNLISVWQLTQNGYQVTFKGHTYIILDKPPNKCFIVNVIVKKNRLFPIHMKLLTQSESFAQNTTHIDES